MEKIGKAVYLCPLRALAAEKYRDFKIFEQLGLRVGISSGDKDKEDRYLKNRDIIISTNEKMDALLRHGIQWISEVGVVIIDEVHLLDEPDRGPTLEVLVQRLRMLNPRAQWLALSATIQNAFELAEWLEATLVRSDWRPVPLKMGINCHDSISWEDGTTSNIIEQSDNPVINLSLDTIKGGGQVLVFSTSRRNCENLAKNLKKAIGPIINKELRDELLTFARKLLVRSSQDPLGEDLAKLIIDGVGFHHAGLSSIQREVLEEGFRTRAIQVLTATPTLAAGVNLPARRVVVHSVWRYSRGRRQPISAMELHQQSGRAGRPKFDKQGEAVLLARDQRELEWLLDRYIHSEYENVRSKLAAEPVLRSHLLALIASSVVSTEDEILDFIESTFYGWQFGRGTVEFRVREVLEFLESEGFILAANGSVAATPYGHRVSQLYVDPLSACMIRAGLEFACSTTNTPTSFSYLQLVASTPDMESAYLGRRDEKKIHQLLNLREKELLLSEIPDEFDNPIAFERLLITSRTGFVLEGWIEEKSLMTLYNEFRVYPGDVRRARETGQWLIASAREISRLLRKENSKFSSIESTLRKLEQRIEIGAKEELLDLTKIRGIGRIRARILFEEGIRNIGEISAVGEKTLAKLPSFGPKIAADVMEQIQLKKRVDDEESEISRADDEQIEDLTIGAKKLDRILKNERRELGRSRKRDLSEFLN